MDIAIGRHAYLVGASNMVIGGTAELPLFIEIGDTELENGFRTIHIGAKLKIQADLNIGDYMTGCYNTKEVTFHNTLTADHGVRSGALTMMDVFCTVCATHEEWCEHLRMNRLKQESDKFAILSTEDFNAVHGYEPRLSPGFQWECDDSVRAICMNCIFDSVFEFSAQRQLAKYRPGAADAVPTTVPACTTDHTDCDRKIAEMQSQIARLTDAVNALLDKGLLKK